MSLPELFATLEAARDHKHQEFKFLAALQGVDLEKDTKKNTWEDIKARAFSGGLAKDASDILAWSGQTAKQQGFGIGNGLSYARGDETEWWKK